MSMWRKTMVYLGLAEEPDEHEAHAPMPTQARPLHRDAEPHGSVTVSPAAQQESDNVRPLSRSHDLGGAHVRPMAVGLGARAQIVAVTDFDGGAAEIGRQYRMGVPVVFDMTDADVATSRRVLDFVSGVTFALRGKMSRVGGRAFLVVPDGVELSLSERERLASHGYGVERGSEPGFDR